MVKNNTFEFFTLGNGDHFTDKRETRINFWKRSDSGPLNNDLVQTDSLVSD